MKQTIFNPGTHKAKAPIYLACIALLLSSSLQGQSNISVLTFGAVPDGILRTDGAMVAGSTVLTSASGSFTSADAGKYIQVIGAGPGGTSRSDGSMSQNSAVLNSPSGTFSSSDVGRGIVVVGAGAGGGNLVGTIQGYTSPSTVTLSTNAQSAVGGNVYYYGAMTLEGSIASVQSSTTVSLSTPALATISNATFSYGTENHAAFQTALDSAGQSGGGVVNVPAPTSCPTGAVCGYVIKASDQQTAKAPGAVKIRYSNVSLTGSSPQTNLFCRGAYSTYTNTIAYPNSTGYIRGFCINIGDNAGPNGSAGEAVSNVSLANLHLYGMTNGNTYNNNFAYPPQASDGWDVTHKAIYMWDNSSFSNITINSVIVQDFKGENIYSGGSTITGMVIENSTLMNYNGDGISMLAAQLQVLNNTISNGSNSAVENSTVSSGSQALVSQVYQGNTVSKMPREGIVVVGVDNGIASGNVQITNNYFDTIAQVNPSGTESAVYISSQGSYLPPANVTVSGNTCHDCYSFGVFQTSGNSVVQGNTFIVDKYTAGNVFSFTYPMSGLTISNNTGSLTANAQSNGLTLGAVYVMNPGWQSGSFAWKNVVLSGNSWTFAGVPQYQFVTNSGPGWKLVSEDNLNWQGDTCTGCTHSDMNHGMVNLSTTTTIEPYGPAVYVMGNSSPITATVDASKQEDGSQVTIINVGSNSVSFASDGNLSLGSTVTLPGGGSSSMNLVYRASLGKFTIANSAGTISATAGTPQSATAGTAFGTALQATVKDANNNPVAGASVTFSAPTSGASATFSGSSTATAVTASNGIATAPTLTANSQTGSYTVTASVGGVSSSASFSLTNNAVAAPPAPAPPVSSGNGSLAGSGTSSTSTFNLTSEGTADWVHWVNGTLVRKTGVTPQLSNYSTVGSGGVNTYTNDPRTLTWSDGTPTATGSDMDGVYINFVGNGFSLSAPADTSTRTLIVHVGGWYAGGTFTASLSDGSAANYVDSTSAANGQFDRNYTLTYHAASAGQKLTITWVVNSGNGNVTLDGAALSGGSGSNPSPAMTLTASAGTSQSAQVSTAFGTALQATVMSGSTPASGVSVTFTAPSSGATGTFSGASSALALTNSNGIATAPAFTANSQTGSYSVTATASGVSGSVSFNLTNTAPPSSGGGSGSGSGGGGGNSGTSGNGSLSGSGNSASSVFNLTTEGTSDWVHWVNGSEERKSGVTPQISNYSVAGSGSVMTYSNDPRTLTWSDGVPTSSGSDADGVYIDFAENGFAFTAPADTTVRTLVVHVGGWDAGATFTAHLSDGSAADFVDSTTVVNGQFDRNYTLTYHAASAGQTLNISWVVNSGNGNVTLNGAALQGAAPVNTGAGTLSGSGNSNAGTFNLTNEGPTDWVHWGDSSLNRKSNVTAQISNYSVVGGGSVLTYSNDPRTLSWTDGTPSTGGSNDDGMYVVSSGQNGFSFTVPAGTTSHTLTVHVGGWMAGGTFTAHLSDGSAPDYVDSTSVASGQFDRNYTLTYTAGSSGQVLKITWTNNSNGGNVTLNGAAFQ